MMKSPDHESQLHHLSLLFFDRYNAEDPLFVADVGRRLVAAAKSGPRVLIMHSSHEAVERAREAFSADEVDPVDDREHLERAVRLANQSITRRLIDEGVPAVSIQGSDRGLLRLSADGRVSTGSAEWLERAIRMGGVPVLSLLAWNSEQSVEIVDEASALDVIASSMSENWEVTIVFFTTNRKSALYEREGTQIDSLDSARLSHFDELPFPIRSGMVSTKASIVVTNSAGLAPDGTVSGTQIVGRG